jgi:hypothetical protein
MPPWSTAKAEELLARLQALEKAKSAVSSMTISCYPYDIEADYSVYAYG